MARSPAAAVASVIIACALAISTASVAAVSASAASASTSAADASASAASASTSASAAISATASAASLANIAYYDAYDDGQVQVRWDESLFADDAFTYSQDLATVSAALCAASSDGDLLHLGEGRYIEPAYLSLGFSPDRISLFSYPRNELNETSVEGSDDQSFSFSIASCDMGDFDLVVVVLRGTNSIAEVFGDGFAEGIPDIDDDLGEEDFLGFRAYRFYLDYEKAVCAGLDYYLQSHAAEFAADAANRDGSGTAANSGESSAANNGSGDVRFLIVGHSLGGSAANLLAAELDSTHPLGVMPDHIYAYTFGGLNSITTDNAHSDFASYGNIWNIFNAYDTFGPLGQGIDIIGFKPTDGDNTVYDRFGNVLTFAKDYRDVFDKGYKRYANHSIAAYLDATANGLVDLRAARAPQVGTLPTLPTE